MSKVCVLDIVQEARPIVRDSYVKQRFCAGGGSFRMDVSARTRPSDPSGPLQFHIRLVFFMSVTSFLFVSVIVCTCLSLHLRSQFVLTCC